MQERDCSVAVRRTSLVVAYRRVRMELVLLTVVALLVAGGCSEQGESGEVDGGSNANGKASPRAQCVAQLEEVGSDLQELTPDCRDEMYLRGVRSGRQSDTFGTVDDKQLLAYAQSLCVVGAGLADDEPASLPLYGDFVRSTAMSWSVEVEIVQAVLGSVQTICPEQFTVLQGLPRVRGSLSVVLSVQGAGRASVAVATRDGSMGPMQVDLPWEHQLHLPEPGLVELAVVPMSSGEVGCRISLSDSVLAEKKPSASPTACRISSDDIDHQLVGG